MLQENTKEQDFKLRIDRLLAQAEKEIGQIGTTIKGERCRAARILDMARGFKKLSGECSVMRFQQISRYHSQKYSRR